MAYVQCSHVVRHHLLIAMHTSLTTLRHSQYALQRQLDLMESLCIWLAHAEVQKVQQTERTYLKQSSVW